MAALLRGVLAGVAARAPDAEVVVFDHGDGDGEACVRLGRPHGPPPARRRALHAPGPPPEQLRPARRSTPSLGTSLHPGSEDLRSADAVLVLAGGDSFADLYGAPRVCAP